MSLAAFHSDSECLVERVFACTDPPGLVVSCTFSWFEIK